MTPTDEQIAKLPVWARQYIKDLRREREVAIRALNQYCESQNPSRIYYDELESTGEQCGPSFKRVYVQSKKISIKHAGVRLEIYAYDPDQIRLQWSGDDHFMCDIAFIPLSYQSAKLVAKDKMR